MNPEQAINALRQWAKTTYNYDLSDQDLQNIIRGVGYSGGPITTQLLEQAKQWASAQAEQMGIQPVSGPAASPAPTPAPSSTPEPAPPPPAQTTERGTPVVQPPTTAGMSPEEAINQLRQWARETYNYELTDQNISDIVRGIGYSGGSVTPQMLQQAKQWAESQAQQMGLISAPAATPSPTPAPTTTPGPSPEPTPAPSQGMTQDQAMQALKDWAQSTYGYALSDAQINAIAQGIGYSGGMVSPQVLEQAKQWAIANQSTLTAMTPPGGTSVTPPSGTTTPPPPATTTPPSTTPGTTSGGGPAPSTDIQYDPSMLGEMQAWAIQTFGRPASTAELNAIAKSIGYTGGAFDKNKLDDWKHYAIIEAQKQGWRPTGPGELILPGFVEPELTGLPDVPTFETFVAPTAPQYAQFQGPEAFQYGEFAAPTKESILQDPGYQARLQEGQKALETSAAAKGLLRTGATLKGLSQYGQEMASQEYGKAFEREKTGYEANRSQAEKEWQSAYQKAMDQYQSARSAQESQYQNAYKSAYDMWQAGTQQKQLGYETSYNKAKDAWLAATQKARGEYEAERSRRTAEYNAAYDRWRFLADEAYRKAQLAAGKANF